MLDNWAKVLQLTLLMIVFALLIAAIAASAGSSWPVSLLNLGLRESANSKQALPGWLVSYGCLHSRCSIRSCRSTCTCQCQRCLDAKGVAVHHLGIQTTVQGT